MTKSPNAMTQERKRPILIDMHPRKILPWALILAVFVTGGAIRFYSFWLPHWKGDQSQYIALAVKLKSGGLDAYNLREIRLRFAPITDDIKLVYPTHEAIGQDGDILKALKLVGQGYYDEPLHMRAPLFPYVLILSHTLFSKEDQPFIVCLTNLAEKVREERPDVILDAQFWAVIVPLFFHAAILVLMLFFGLKYFDRRITTYAIFLMTTNATGIMTSQRIWAEEMMTFWVMLSLFLFAWFYPKKNWFGVFVAGVAGGLAILSKQTAGIILIVVWLYSFFSDGKKDWNTRSFLKKIFNPQTINYTIAFFLVSGYWFLKVYEVYGDPLHKPGEAMTLSQQTDITGWLESLNQRPTPMIFFTLGTVWICPLFGFVYGTFTKFRRAVIDTWKGEPVNLILILLWIWALVYIALLTQPWNLFANYNQEHRLFYPAYPALVFLAAYGLNRLRIWLEVKFPKPYVAEGILIVLLIMNAWWSISIGMKPIFENDVLL